MAKIMTNNTTMIAWQDQKLNSISGIKNKDSVSEFQIPGAGGVKRSNSSQVGTCEMRNAKIPKQAHQLEFWIPGVGGVKSRDSSSQES
jgi:hypothetical protein